MELLRKGEGEEVREVSNARRMKWRKKRRHAGRGGGRGRREVTKKNRISEEITGKNRIKRRRQNEMRKERKKRKGEKIEEGRGGEGK